MIVFPNCKINLGLHILQKRADGFHDLETVFYPVEWRDALEIVHDSKIAGDIEFTTSGLAIDSSPDQNICVKAFRLLKKDFPGLPPVKIHLHKTIPPGAGLGGGSSDGAFVLRLLNKQFRLGLTEDRLLDYALLLGSDCPFFIKNKPSYGAGRGEKLEPLELDLSGYATVLINPGIHVHTGQAFSKITPNNQRPSILEIINKPIEDWKGMLKNDFEETVFAQHPEIRQIKEKMYEQGAVYASMSGSGASVYGLFKKVIDLKFSFPPHYFVKQI